MSDYLERRKRAHFRQLELRTHCNPLVLACYIKCPAAMVFEVLEHCESDHLNQRERYWIGELKPTMNVGGVLSRGKPNPKNRVWHRRKSYTLTWLQERIIARRLELGLTMAQAAAAAGFSNAQKWWQYERGSQQNPRLFTMCAIAVALNWPVKQLLRRRSSAR